MSGIAPAPSNFYNVYQFFNFYPSKGIIILALVLFSLATLLVLASTIYTRRWFMLIAVGVGAAEIAGFAFRWSMLSDPAYGSFVAMQCLLVISPSFLALCEYITLGKLVRDIKTVTPDIKDFLRPRFIQWAYFLFEIFSLGLQGAGVGLSVSTEGVNNNLTAGKTLLIVGLAFLVVIIAVFICNSIYVCLRSEYGVRQSRPLIYMFAVLYITSVLLLIRNIFRLVEFAVGFYGYIAIHEKYFYGLDSLPVVLTLTLFGIFNYGFFLQRFEKEMKPANPMQTEMV